MSGTEDHAKIDRSISNFIKTFTNGFKFVTRSEVDLQQDHQRARIRKNMIVPCSRGSTSRGAHTSQGSGSSS
jgi:hypothetical protein